MKDTTVSKIFSKVPEVTLWFWVIKILCTTVGETAADFLATDNGLNWGLVNTMLAISVFLIIMLFFQFKVKKYIPGIYWLAVVLISVVGTQITDYLHDGRGVTLATTTLVFGGILALVFALWYAVEKTLSIHSIYTLRREAFYWLTILFTFALGTAAGDYLAETLQLGYLSALLIFAGALVVVTILHMQFKLNAVLSFWIAYILTRPLGASIGDYLSQAKVDGGLGLGTVVTSALFLIAILGTVIYLTMTKKDAIAIEAESCA